MNNEERPFGGFKNAFTQLGGGGETEEAKPKDPTTDKGEQDEDEECSERS